jgi:hypothetical protein
MEQLGTLMDRMRKIKARLLILGNLAVFYAGMHPTDQAPLKASIN